MPLTIEQFTQQVSSSGLMTEDGLQGWLKSESFEECPQTGEQLARELVKRKKLTKFQAEQIHAGKGKSLILGNYVILDKLGQGGMGMVLKAEHKRMKRLVALKVISPAAMKSKDAVQRFHREVEAAAKLTHPNIVNAFDADEAKGTHFLVMEYVEGSDLHSLVKKSGPLSVNLAIDVILQAARGLEYAHKQGVIHRDIKPANLLLNHEGVIKILDMGLARIEPNELGVQQAELTNTGAILGTIDYMSPEQAEDTKHADARSDIYSLGCSLYYLLAGHAVYTADTIMKKLLAHRDAPLPSLVSGTALAAGFSQGDTDPVTPVASAIPLTALDFVFHKMIAKKASDRYQSMTAVIAALEQCRAGHPQTITQPTEVARGSGNDLQHFLQEMTDNDPNATITEPIAEETLTSTAGEVKTDPHARRLGLRPDHPARLGTESQPTRRIPTVVAIALASVVLLLAGVITYIKTNRGTLRIEINDPQIEVTVQGTDIVVKDEGQEDIRLNPGEHTLHVKRGDLEFDTDTITLKKGETVAVKIELIGRRVRAMRDGTLLGHRELRQALPKPGTTTPSVSPDRRIAEQRKAAKKLIEMGCDLRGFFAGARFNGIVQVPDGDFSIDMILGTEKTIYRDEHAELFAQFPDLEIFEGGVFEMSAKGVQWLAKLPKLWKIGCNESRFDDHAVEQLANLRSLTVLHLDTKNLTPIGLAHISRLIDLRDLDLIGANFDDDALQHLKPLRQLEYLGLAQTAVRGPGLHHLAETQSLKGIHLNWQKAGNAGLAAVSQFKRLEIIEILDVASITDVGLAHLKDMPRLQLLTLTNTSITDAGLEHLKSMPALLSLNLSGTNVTDTGMQHLADLPKLQSFWLANTQVGDASIDVLKKLPIVEFLLDNTRITDNGLRLLKEFKQLEVLNIGESGFTDSGLQELPAIPRLRRLGLRGKKLGQTAWENVGKLTRLEHLDINQTNINDEGLAHLIGMTNLVNLELRHTDVTDQGLMQLRNLPKLRDVDCNDSPGVTPAGVQALLNALPSLRGEAASPDRRIAEWVLKLGGSITIRQNDNEKAIDKNGQLPQGNVDLISAELSRNRAVNDENVGILRDALRLQHLGLGETSVSDRGLEWIGNLTQLESLHLFHSRITGKTVERMKPLNCLRTLRLNGISVSDDAFKSLSNAKQLEILVLATARLTDASTQLLSQFSNLSELGLTGSSITATGLVRLESLNNLQQLALSGTSFQAAEFEAVAKLRALRSLHLSSLRIREKLLDPLESLGELRILALTGATFEADSAASLRRLRTLKELNLDESNVRDADLAHVATLPVLELLRLETTGISDKGLMHLEKLKTLRHFVLSGTKVTKAGVEKLHEALPQCRIEWDGGAIEPSANVERDHAKRLLELGASIDVVVANIERRVDRLDDFPEEEFHVSNVYGGVYGKSKEALVEWNRLPHLKHARLGQCGVTDADLRLLGECTELVVLEVGECPAITDAGVAHLKRLKKLEHLDLLGTQLTDRGLEELRGMVGLRVLEVSGTKITDAGMPTIATLRELRALDLVNTRTTDAGLATLLGLEHLDGLGLRATDITDRGIDHILKFRNLNSISLGSDVTNDGVKKLLTAPHLRKQLTRLYVSGNPQITDEICDALVKCEAIGGLWLDDTQISDAGLKQLSGLTTLGEIWLTGSKVTAAGVEAFRKARPQCGIAWEAKAEAAPAPAKK